MSGGNSTPADRFKQSTAPPDDEEEFFIWSGGYSGKAMYGSWMLAAAASVLLAVLCFVLFGKLELSQRMMIFGALMALVWGGMGLLLLYRRLSVSYELTSQRFVHRSGILVRRTDRIELLDVDDVTFVQGIIQRIFNVGTIRMESSDRTHPQLDLIGIADVENVYNMIDDARRTERRRRGLHIENI